MRRRIRCDGGCVGTGGSFRNGAVGSDARGRSGGVCGRARSRSVLGPEGLYFSGDAAVSLTTALRRCATLSVEARARLSEMQRKRAVDLFSLEATAARYRALLNTDAVRPPDAF